MLSIRNLFVRKKTNVNSTALHSFNLKFPKAKQVLWQQVDVSKWQVHFYVRKNKYSALFNHQGDWLETVSLVTLEKTPPMVIDKFKEKFNKEGILQIYHFQSPKKSLYEIKWHNGIDAIKLIYDITGKIVGRLIL